MHERHRPALLSPTSNPKHDQNQRYPPYNVPIPMNTTTTPTRLRTTWCWGPPFSLFLTSLMVVCLMLVLREGTVVGAKHVLCRDPALCCPLHRVYTVLHQYVLYVCRFLSVIAKFVNSHFLRFILCKYDVLPCFYAKSEP